MTFHVGQTVLVHDTYRRSRPPEERTVAKVARKYVYIEEYKRPVAFDKETGHEKGEFARRRIYTREQWADSERRHGLFHALRVGHSVEFLGPRDKYSTDTLAKVLELLDADLLDAELSS